MSKMILKRPQSKEERQQYMAMLTEYFPDIRKVLDQQPSMRFKVRNCAYVAVDEDGDCDVVGLARVVEYPDYIEIANIAVRQGYCGRGIGRDLVKMIVEEYACQGISKITARSMHSGEFFTKVGFRKSAMTPQGHRYTMLLRKYLTG